MVITLLEWRSQLHKAFMALSPTMRPDKGRAFGVTEALVINFKVFELKTLQQQASLNRLGFVIKLHIRIFPLIQGSDKNINICLKLKMWQKSG